MARCKVYIIDYYILIYINKREIEGVAKGHRALLDSDFLGGSSKFVRNPRKINGLCNRLPNIYVGPK